jgi:hypothetical protein
MADVFISYSRKDKDFVKALHAALVQQNRETWVDWEDIPLTADWWQEIQSGIETAIRLCLSLALIRSPQKSVERRLIMR